jgi:hypothetical protein
MVSLLLAAATGLQIHAQPPTLELGKTAARAVLHIRSPVEPRLSASVGVIVGLRQEGPDAWAADYVAPHERFPRVAVIAAVAYGEVAWTAVPLFGRGLAQVQTRPGARISVQIGGRTFGPAEADARGIARVPVVVPPGVHEVQHRGRRIALPVPPSARLHVVLLKPRVQADAVEKVGIFVIVTDDAGKARPEFETVFWPERGEVSALEKRGPGELAGIWTVPPGAAGPLKLRAAVADFRELQADAALAVDAGRPETLALSTDRESVVAGTATEVALRATARDAEGNPSADALDLEGPPGFGTLVQNAPGEWRLRPPDAFAGLTAVRLTAHPRGASDPSASVVVRLVPAEPVAASIEPAVAVVRAGSAGIRLRVVRTDRFGNVVPGAAPAGTADDGIVASIDSRSDGAFDATYVPPRRWNGPGASVEMRWPEATAQRRLTVLPPLASFVVSPKVGGLTNFGGLSSPVAAVEASLRTERFGPELALSTEAAWYFGSHQQPIRFGNAQARDDFFSFAAQLSLRVHPGPRVTLWAGAGPSLTAVASRLRVADQPEISESAVVAGALISAGFECRFAHLVPFAELRWSWHQDPALDSLTGAVRAASLLLGTRLELL